MHQESEPMKDTEKATISDRYAVLDCIGPKSEYGKEEYWIGLDGHAHSQNLSGAQVGALGKLFHGAYRVVEP
jgi:hypothetical protein